MKRGTPEKIDKRLKEILSVEESSLSLAASWPWETSHGGGGQFITAVIGPNGAGKTTLINVISGPYHRPRESVLQRRPRSQSSPTQELQEIGIASTFQNLRLFRHMTTLENVMVARHIKASSGISDMRAEASLKPPRRKVCGGKKSMEFLDFVGLATRPTSMLFPCHSVFNAI